MDIFTIVPLASTLGCGVLLVFVSISQRTRIRDAFIVALSFAVIRSFSSFMLHTNFAVGQEEWWYGALTISMLAMIVSYYHFVRAFANKPTGWATYFGYGMAAVLFVLSLSGFYIHDVYVKEGFLFIDENNYIFYMLALLLLSFDIAIFYELIKRYRGLTDPNARNTAIYLLIGFATSTFFVLSNLIPAFRGYPIDQIGSFLFCLIITYAIIRHQLINLTFIFRQAMYYSAMGALFLITFSGWLLLVYIVSDYSLSFGSVLLIALLTAITGGTFWQRARIFISDKVDHIYYGANYCYHKELLDFVECRIPTVSSLVEFGRELLVPLSKALTCKHTYLLLPEVSGVYFTTGFSVPEQSGDSRLKIRYDTSITRWLEQKCCCLTRDILDTNPQFFDLWKDERSLLVEFDIRLLFPLISRGALIGILVLDSKESGSYTLDDINLVEKVTCQVAAGLEKEFLQEQLRGRERELTRMYRELKQTYDELCGAQDRLIIQSDKLSALGEMTSGIAHNFNNTLTTILGRAQLSFDLVQDEKVKRNLELIEQTALDAAKMVRKLQDFARVRVDNALDITNLNELVKSALEFIKPRLDEQCQTLGSSIEIVLDLSQMAHVEGCEAELKEALINVLLNSMEAMPHGGKLTIKSAQDSEFAVISISDTGIGMTEHVQKRIFDPFFTTKGLQGLGMGLKMVHRAVQRHRGKISVSSKPGSGSTFTVQIPVTTKTKMKDVPIEYRRKGPKDANILVVDDDQGPRDILYDILTGAGYSVDIAASGQEGLSLTRQKYYDLVFTDLGMPDMSGWDLANAIVADNSETMIVLVTGWGVQIDMTKIKERGIDTVIAKPYRKQNILAVAGQLLGERINIQTT